MLTPYPDYTPSGLPWAPQIPEGWQVQRNGRLFSHRVETGYPNLPILEVSLRTGVRVRDMVNGKRKQVMSAKEKYKRAVKGDIAYNMMRMWQGAVGPAPTDGLVSPAYVVVRPHAGVNTAYFSYLFRTAAYMQEVNKFSRGIVADRNRLYWESFKQMPSLVPGINDQNKIVSYLRAQDAHFAHFIKAKRDLIALLSERRLELVDRTIRRGLSASTALSPSGIDWIGEVPAHWRPARLSDCIQVCRAGMWGVDPTDKNEEDHLVCVRVADFDTERLKVATSKLTVRAVTQAERSGRLLSPGDLLLEKSGGGDKTPVGRVVAFDLDQPAVCSNFLSRLVPNRALVRSDYLLLLLNHLHARRVVVPFIKQTTGIQNLDSKAYFKLGVVLPGLEEQDEILKALRAVCDPIESAIAQAESEIRLIREYRDRQIADAVTGQIDVRSWKPGPEDQITEEALTALDDDDDNDSTEEETDGDDGHD